MDRTARKEYTAPTHFWMRNVADLVRCAHRFKSDLKISFNGKIVDGRSILGIMTLAIQKGNRFLLEASGEDATPCLSAMEACIQTMKDPLYCWEDEHERLPAPSRSP